MAVTIAFRLESRFGLDEVEDFVDWELVVESQSPFGSSHDLDPPLSKRKARLRRPPSQSPFGSSHDLDYGCTVQDHHKLITSQSPFGSSHDLDPAKVEVYNDINRGVGHNRLSARVTIWTVAYQQKAAYGAATSQSPFGSSHDLDRRVQDRRSDAGKGHVTIAFRLESRFGQKNENERHLVFTARHNRLSARVTIWTYAQ